MNEMNSLLVCEIVNIFPIMLGLFHFLSTKHYALEHSAGLYRSEYVSTQTELLMRDLRFLARNRRELRFFWALTQRVMVISYRHFGTDYRYHLQGVKNY